MPEIFIDDLVAPYYEVLGLGYHKAPVRGQIGWVPILYTHEHREIWRPQSTDQTGTIATSFIITTAGQDAHRRTTPLSSPRLTTREEFPVVRAKIRPVIVLTLPMPEISGPPGKREDRINRGLCLVAPLYSVLDPVTDVPKYGEEFVKRVRKLEYEQFSYAPESVKARIRSSIVRLDAIQAVYHANLELTPIRLSSEALSILQGQIECYLAGGADTVFHDAREMLLNPDAPSDQA